MAFTYVVALINALPIRQPLQHMRALAGPGATVAFTHLSRASSASLHASFSTSEPGLADAACYQEGVLVRMQSADVLLEKVCLLDPRAEKMLAPEDGDGRPPPSSSSSSSSSLSLHGDDPPRDRTGELRALGFPTRHLGPVQMTTDTALGVTKMVVQDKGRPPFLTADGETDLGYLPMVQCGWRTFPISSCGQDQPTIVFNKHESVEMPFRYIADGKEPRLPPGMKEHLHEDMNKSFDF
ncbi:hypothetical protein EW146_g8350 [Bondarzewia mesenterica]|uniref:Uncharacterized protein n=1 Tax=Bondarzewia mesenterica TaxID=1095465 RepID=A0A4S4LFQ6_9AGAM|nr:hypothetical protein EW146_g8350 [Bondarzewia mesenterica]